MSNGAGEGEGGRGGGGGDGESEPPTFVQDQFCNYFKTGGVARIYALY